MIPACRDCKHHRRLLLSWGYSVCTREEVGEPPSMLDSAKAAVKGREAEPEPIDCVVARLDQRGKLGDLLPNLCGTAGRFFEPRR
jgi:hypothetical protein